MTDSFGDGSSTVAAGAESVSPLAKSDADGGPASASGQQTPRRSLPWVREVQGQPRKNIVWLASYPKPGNTWVRVFLRNLIREMRGETEGSQDINDLGHFAIWENSLPHFTKVLGKPPTEATMEEIARARPQVQRMLSAEQPNLALAKTHLAFGNDHGYPTIEPSVTKGAIYIVRDPRDVAISYAHHCGKSVGAIIADMATPAFHVSAKKSHVGETIGSWSQHVESWLKPKPYPLSLVRYEDMLERPLKTFADMADFLGLQPTQRQLLAATQKCSFEELRRQEQEKGFIERPKSSRSFFRVGRSSQWLDALSQIQVQSLESSLGNLMSKFGYVIK